MKAPIENRKLLQICVVCNNAKQVNKDWAELLGQTYVGTQKFDDPATNGVTNYMGTETRNAGMETNTFDLAGRGTSIQLEVMQAHGGPSEWQQFMDFRGIGVHHVAFGTQDWEPCLQRIEEKTGIKVVQKGYPFMTPEAGYAYFDTKASIGTTLELLYFGARGEQAEKYRQISALFADSLGGQNAVVDTKLPVAVTLVVRSLEESRQKLASLLGLTAPSETMVSNGSIVAYGTAIPDAQYRKTSFDLVTVQFEMIQPVYGDTVWQRFADQWTDGLLNIAFEAEDLSAQGEKLEAFGLPLVQTGIIEDGLTQHAIYDGMEKLGAMIEIRSNEAIRARLRAKRLKRETSRKFDQTRRYNESTRLGAVLEDAHAVSVINKFLPGMLSRPDAKGGMRLPLGIAFRLQDLSEASIMDALDEMNR